MSLEEHSGYRSTNGLDANLHRLSIQDIEDAVESASSIAREIANGKGFKGFKISHVRRIAMAFRLDQVIGMPAE